MYSFSIMCLKCKDARNHNEYNISKKRRLYRRTTLHEIFIYVNLNTLLEYVGHNN